MKPYYTHNARQLYRLLYRDHLPESRIPNWNYSGNVNVLWNDTQRGEFDNERITTFVVPFVVVTVRFLSPFFMTYHRDFNNCSTTGHIFVSHVSIYNMNYSFIFGCIVIGACQRQFMLQFWKCVIAFVCLFRLTTFSANRCNCIALIVKHTITFRLHTHNS
jgi:hypothetical protein